MSPRILVACLMRNESERFLRSALRAWGSFADHILVLDDSSTDDSKKIARSEGAEVLDVDRETLAWGHEAPTRALLWKHARERTENEDYIFVLDADMVPAKSPRGLLEAAPDAVAFPLFDLWTDKPRLAFRGDSMWQGHLHPRIWLVRASTSPEEPQWSPRGVHCGHLPLNMAPERIMIAPREYGLLHYAYSDHDLRQQKAAQYQAVYDDLSAFERAHASSILDAEAQVIALPFHPDLTLERA